MGRIVNRKQLAEEHGVSLPTVDGWVRRGCPIESPGARGRAAEFDASKVSIWLDRYAQHQLQKPNAVAAGKVSSANAEIVVQTLGYIYEQSTGIIADAAVSAGASCALAHKIDQEAQSHLRDILDQILKAHDIPDHHLDEYSSWAKDIDWKKAHELLGQKFEPSVFDNGVEIAQQDRRRLPRNEDEGEKV